MREPQIGRVRGLYIDFQHSGPYPMRGDRLFSGKTLYFVLSARQVNRRDPNANPRIQMQVIQQQDLPEGTEARLDRYAIRHRGKPLQFDFSWYPRKKKSVSFEQYMRQGHGKD